MTSQGYFPLSGLALPAGVDWEKIRAYSLDYKKSCKQSHIVATGKKTDSWQHEGNARLHWLADWLRSVTYLVSKVVDLHFGTPQLSACFWLSPPGIRVRSDQAIVTAVTAFPSMPVLWHTVTDNLRARLISSCFCSFQTYKVAAQHVCSICLNSLFSIHKFTLVISP